MIISIIMFIIVAVAILFMDFGFAMDCILALVWLGYTAYYLISNNGGKLIVDKRKDLQEANKKGLFKGQVRRLISQYDSVYSREEFFKHSVSSDSNLQDVYRRIIEQVESNMDSAIAYISSYDYYTRPNPTYLNTLVTEGDELISKFNTLIQQIVDIDTNLTRLDTTYIDDVVECMEKMKMT